MKYKIPVVWQLWGLVEVDADNIEEAKKKVGSMPLPSGEYIENSFEIDEEGIPIYNETRKKNKA